MTNHGKTTVLAEDHPHRSLGQRPRKNVDHKRLAEGHIHLVDRDEIPKRDATRLATNDEHGLRPNDAR